VGEGVPSFTLWVTSLGGGGSKFLFINTSTLSFRSCFTKERKNCVRNTEMNKADRFSDNRLSLKAILAYRDFSFDVFCISRTKLKKKCEFHILAAKRLRWHAFRVLFREKLSFLYLSIKKKCYAYYSAKRFLKKNQLKYGNISLFIMSYIQKFYSF
jgi:hypothetical protein